VGRRKQRGSRDTVLARDKGLAKDKGPAKNRPVSGLPAPVDRPTLPTANPPRRNLLLLMFSIALFVVWLVVLLILATFR
jgi:hypothetical protein